MKKFWKITLLVFFVVLVAFIFTFFGNNVGMWRINNSSTLVEEEYGKKMEAWRLKNFPGVESYKVTVVPAKFEEMKGPLDVLNTKVIVDYYKIEVWDITKDELLTKETLAKEFVFFVNPIFNEVTPNPDTEKTLKNY